MSYRHESNSNLSPKALLVCFLVGVIIFPPLLYFGWKRDQFMVNNPKCNPTAAIYLHFQDILDGRVLPEYQ